MGIRTPLVCKRADVQMGVEGDLTLWDGCIGAYPWNHPLVIPLGHGEAFGISPENVHHHGLCLVIEIKSECKFRAPGFPCNAV